MSNEVNRNEKRARESDFDQEHLQDLLWDQRDLECRIQILRTEIAIQELRKDLVTLEADLASKR